MTGRKFKVIVIGSSAGGLYALESLLSTLPKDYPLPIIIAQHRSKDGGDLLEDVLQHKCQISIRQADEKLEIEKGYVYIAPPGYHLLVEENETLSLSSDEQISLGRPSIDILFETAAAAYRKNTIGIILTGANSDGARGISAINKVGGTTIAQSPDEALYPFMPQAAINRGGVAHIWKLDDIRNFLHQQLDQ